MKNREKCPACGEPLGAWERETRPAFNDQRGYYEVNTGRHIRSCAECPYWEDNSESNNIDEARREVARRAEELTPTGIGFNPNTPPKGPCE